MSRNKKGFTLVELMIVVAILGVLAAIALPQYLDYIRVSKWTEAKTNLMSIRLLLEQHYSDNGEYIAASEHSAAQQTLKVALKGFEPKAPSELIYDYYVVPGDATLTTYTARAVKRGETSKFFTITHDNVKLDQDGNAW